MTSASIRPKKSSAKLRCLVTGGAGFIGSHLVDRLLTLGHRVIVVDNLATGRLANLQQHRNNPKLSFHQADVADLPAIAPAFKRIQQVFHLAALADIVPSIQKPLDYHRANVDGTASVLEAARLHAGSSLQSLVYAASSSCYGLPDHFPTPESADIRTMYPYALTKHLGERYVLHWRQCYRLPALALRLFNVYGPRSRTTGAYGAVFGVFLAQKLAGKPFTVVGDGKQTRDFTFVTDVAHAFQLAAQSPQKGPVYNVGSGGTYSINQLVKLLGGPVIHLPKRPGEPDCTFADTRKIRLELGWRPQVPLEEGVRIMLEHIDLWRDAPVWDRKSIAQATKDWFKHLSSASPGPGETK